MADLGALVIDVVAQNKQILANLTQVESRLSSFEKSTTGKLLRVENAFGRMAGGISRVNAVIAATASALAVRELVQYADAWKGIEGRLKLVTKTQEQLTQAQAATFAIAQDTRSSLTGTVDLYNKYATAAKQLGLNQEEVAKLTSLTTKAIVESGASAAGAGAAILQFGQALDGGVMRGEEFNSVNEQANALLRHLADGLNVPIGKMRMLAEAGELTAERITKALLSQEKIINEKFALLPTKVEEAWTQLNNSITRFIGIADNATGVGAGLAKVLQLMAAAADRVSGMFDSATLGELRTLSNEIVALQKQRDEFAKSPPFPFSVLPEGALQNQLSRFDVQIEEKFKRAQALREEFNRRNPDDAPKPTKAPPGVDLSGKVAELEAKKSKAGKTGIARIPRGPDTLALQNRFLEEASRRELQLQREIADATGNTAAFEKAALAEIAAARQSSLDELGKQSTARTELTQKIEEQYATETKAITDLQAKLATTSDPQQRQGINTQVDQHKKALEELAARRTQINQQSIQQSVALAAIEKTALLERQALSIEVAKREIEARQESFARLSQETDQRIQLIEMATSAQRTELQLQEQQGAFALQVARDRGASVEQLTGLYQQQAAIVQQLGQVESNRLSKQIAEQQSVIAAVKQRYDAEAQALATLEAQRASVQDPLEQGVLDARIKTLREEVERLSASYLELVARVQGWSEEQKRAAAETHEALQRVGQDLHDLNAPVSVRVFEQLGRDAQGSADRMADAWLHAFDQMGEGLSEFAMTGKLNVREFLYSILSDFNKALNREIFSQLFAQLFPSDPSAQGGGAQGAVGKVIDFLSGGVTGIPQPTASQGSTGVASSIATPALQTLLQFPFPVQPPWLPNFPQQPLPPPVLPEQVSGITEQVTLLAGSVSRITDLSTTGIDKIAQLGGNTLDQLLQFGSNSLTLIGQIGAQVLSLIAGASASSSGGGWIGAIGSLFGSFFGGGGAAAATAHEGLMPGKSLRVRQVPAGLFSDAPKLHTGAMPTPPLGAVPGLKPDEFPAILQHGEAVLSRKQMRGAESDGKELRVPILHAGTLPEGKPMTALVSPVLFANAPKLHAGTMPRGFAPEDATLARAPLNQALHAERLVAGIPETERGMGIGSRGSDVINVTFNFPNANAESFRRSESQVQASAARALARANKRNN